MTISSQIIENLQSIYADFKHFVAVKFKYSIIFLIIVITTMLMITEQHFGSAGIIVFILAYLSKGMRRSSANTKTFVRTESVARSLDRSQ
jgi:hypothetical protein